ncbi:hypothetical protein KP509_02G036200 [Ceratopteris richardii]|uniref:Uncharacterized protein n=1 Tax=Ceratopteris richardii TaxID=49495 RepID=A0A8T2V4S1_CERRI|nr:hypothetical protein KP509_02G036200 [Ceratopteris richardii]
MTKIFQYDQFFLPIFLSRGKILPPRKPRSNPRSPHPTFLAYSRTFLEPRSHHILELGFLGVRLLSVGICANMSSPLPCSRDSFLYILLCLYMNVSCVTSSVTM